MKIGAMVESFKLGFRGGVEKAASLGVAGVQKFATGKELLWTDAEIREALDIVKSSGLVFSAICGDFGYGFHDPARNPEMIEKSKRVMELAKKLECDIVTTHVHRMTEEESESNQIIRAALEQLGSFAESMDAVYALETGPETGRVMDGFLSTLSTRGIRVNFDPANLVMCMGERPEEALKYVGKRVIHTHAKDGIRRGVGPFPGTDTPERAAHNTVFGVKNVPFVEVPLGQGDVNFDTYLPALAAAGYDGFLTIERECGATPEADIAMAVSFLKEKVAKFGLN
ncbi:MAG: sugar phosphate isomerase/epimerase [Clostridia bacterium]|nr:sugar phosphate isomerase/epimerase [Clostridia bacterium]